jgi:hypothetical protein
VKLPADQQPPTDMPPIAWSNSGELLMYSDIKKMRNGSALQPGQVLPPDTTRALRRAYYSAVSHMDDQLGRVMAALESSGFKDETVVSFWGDQCAIRVTFSSVLRKIQSCDSGPLSLLLLYCSGWQLGEYGQHLRASLRIESLASMHTSISAVYSRRY